MPFFKISLETANKFYTSGWFASIAGAVITAVGVILLMWGTRVRDHETESQLSRASLLTAQTSERAAKLEVRAEELNRQNLELEKAVAPRMLEQSASARALEPFAGIEAFIVSVPDFESRRLAKQINFMLDYAHWKVTLLVQDDDRIVPGVEVRCISGKRISENKQRMIDVNIKAKEAITILADQLRENDIETKVLTISPMMPISQIWDAKFPQDAIVIRVGLKPITESFIEKRIQELRGVAPNDNIFFGNEKSP